MTPEAFAEDEYRDLETYRALAAIEPNLEFKRVLEELIVQETNHFEFWREHTAKKTYRVPCWYLARAKLLRKILGLTFTIKLLERTEREAIGHYRDYLASAATDLKPKIEAIIEDELRHERECASRIKENQIAFVGNIILGLNDGLIELSGALTGFSFAFLNTRLAGFTGLIVGIAAALSMASSAYLQARHEKNSEKHPVKAAIYTGVSYIIVVIILVAPYFFTHSAFVALSAMFVLMLAVIAVTSYYTAVLFDRRFRTQFVEMLVFSVGVAAISFVIGSTFRRFTSIGI